MTDRINLIVNPSFETSTDGWQPDTTGLILDIAEGEGWTGSYALAVTCDQPASTERIETSDPIPVVAGETYTMQARVRAAQSPCRVSVFCRWLDDQGLTVDTSFSASILTSTSGWSLIVATADVPDGAASIQPGLQFGDGIRDDLVYYVDAVMVEQAAQAYDYFDGDTQDTDDTIYDWTGTPNGSTSTATAVMPTPDDDDQNLVVARTNLCVNPSFEVDNTAWLTGNEPVVDEGFETDNGGFTATANTLIGRGTEHAHGGGYALRVSAQADGNAYVSRGISVAPDTGYSLTIWSYQEDADDMWLRIGDSGGTNVGGAFNTPTRTEVGEWVRHNVTFTTLPTANGIALYLGSGTKAGGRVWWDDLRLDANAGLTGEQAAEGDTSLMVATATSEIVSMTGPDLIPAVEPGQPYTMQVKIRAKDTPQPFALQGIWWTPDGSATVGEWSQGEPITDTTDDWTVLSGTATAPDGAGLLQPQIIVAQGVTDTAAPVTIHYLDAVLVEQSDIAGDYFDGDTGDTSETIYDWTGTPGLSTSTASVLADEDLPDPEDIAAYALAAAEPLPGPPRYPDIIINDAEQESGSGFTLYARALEALTGAAVEDVDDFVEECDRDDVPVDEYRRVVSRWVTIA